MSDAWGWLAPLVYRLDPERAHGLSLFGLTSGAALATVVGVLVEVPVMLSLVAIANRTRGGFSAH